MARILVVDDEIGIRELLSEILYDEGHTVELAENAAEARAARLKQRPDLVLLDIWMPDTDGVSLLKEWGSQGLLDMPVIMMSGHATVDTAVEATRIGAVDFLEKPITLQKLLQSISAALSQASQSSAKAKPAAPAAASAQTVSAPEHDQPLVTTPAPPMGGQAPAAPEPNPAYLGNIPLDQPFSEAGDEFERQYFEYHLKQENYSMTRVSEKSGLERTHLYRKLKQLGIEVARRRSSGNQ